MLEQQDPTPVSPSSINIENITSRFEASTVDASDLLVAGIALVAGIIIGAIVRSAVRRLLRRTPGLHQTTVDIIARLAGYLVALFGLVVALSALGLDFGPVITLLVIIGLVAVLVGRSLLADLGAGLVLQSRRPITVGEVVRTQGYEGVVEDIDGRVVRVRTWDGWLVSIRNSDVLTDPIVKVAEPDRVRVEFAVGLHYDTDLDGAVDVARRTLADTPGVLDAPPPEALVDEFADSTIDLRCWIWVDPTRQWLVKDVAMRDVKRELDADGIVIAYPQRVLHAP